jgi:hypothetical protein
MGVGVIIREEKGSVVVALSKPFMVLHEPASAEACSCCAHKVEFCRDGST